MNKSLKKQWLITVTLTLVVLGTMTLFPKLDRSQLKTNAHIHRFADCILEADSISGPTLHECAKL